MKYEEKEAFSRNLRGILGIILLAISLVNSQELKELYGSIQDDKTKFKAFIFNVIKQFFP